jgi:hypothetical protein
VDRLARRVPSSSVETPAERDAVTTQQRGSLF